MSKVDWTKWKRLISTATTIGILTYSAIVCLWWCVSGGIWNDEHQFMASAFMVAEYGLHPYKDFAYFHMPNLVYLYTPFFFTSHPFMLARLFVGICGLAISLTIFLYARSRMTSHGKLISLVVPICITGLLIHSSLFGHGLECVWNHTPATLCAILSFLLHCHAIRNKKPSTFFLSGLSLGMAIGIRLSFAPLIIPFVLAIAVFLPATFKTKGLYSLAFLAGGFVSNLPAIFFLYTSLDDFLFGNLAYPKLNTLYREEMLYPIAMDLFGKIKYLLKEISAQPSDVLVLVVTLYSLVLFIIHRIRSRERPNFEMMFLLVCLPFLYYGCIVPTPSWPQYYFVLMPFFMLLTIHALSGLRREAFSEASVVLLVVVAIVSFIYGSPLVKGSAIRSLTKPELLPPIQLHKEAGVIKSLIDSKGEKGRVLTLSPIYAVESHLPIYEEFVTGPFAWRVSYLLSYEEATAKRLPLSTTIKSFLNERPPSAILTGKEYNKDLEIQLIKAAKELGYRPVMTPTRVAVWLPSE